MKTNESLDDWKKFDSLMKNATPYPGNTGMEDLIMERIQRYESIQKKTAHNFKKAKGLLIIAAILYILLASIDQTIFQIDFTIPWLFESTCILSFLFLFDKLLAFKNNFRRLLPPLK